MSESAPRDGYFQPDTLRADFAYWAKMAKWTEEEAVSLFLGLNPEYTANDDRISYGQTELYAEKYFSLRKLACRATDQKQVGHPYTPARWLAKECDFPVPLRWRRKL
jgi:hypothetical protein